MLNGLPTAADKIHPSYPQSVLDVSEAERLTIQRMNVPGPSVPLESAHVSLAAVASQEQLNAVSESGRFRKSTNAHFIAGFINDASDKMWLLPSHPSGIKEEGPWDWSQAVLGAIVSRWGAEFWDSQPAQPFLLQGVLGFQDQAGPTWSRRSSVLLCWRPLRYWTCGCAFGSVAFGGPWWSTSTRLRPRQWPRKRPSCPSIRKHWSLLPLVRSYELDRRVMEHGFARLQKRWAMVEANRNAGKEQALVLC